MPGIDRSLVQATFQAEGFAFPLDAMSTAEAADYQRRFDALEAPIARADIARNGQLNQVHAVLCFVAKIVRNRHILDAVEAVIGPDIMVWGSTFFIKKPRTPDYVSWHQDLRYWGLSDSDAMVSAWLALGPAHRGNGCMRFMPKSHRLGLLEHQDAFSADNLLYRGQIAQVGIDEAAAVDVELAPGQFSLHHGHLLHASPPNPSATTRCGLTINYVAPHNRQVVASHDFAMLVRGEDCHGHFAPVPAPETDLSPTALDWHRRLLTALDESAFAGAKARGRS